MTDESRDDYVKRRHEEIVAALTPDQQLEIVRLLYPKIIRVPGAGTDPENLLARARFLAIPLVCAERLAEKEYANPSFRLDLNDKIALIREMKLQINHNAEVKQGPSGRPGHNVVPFKRPEAKLPQFWPGSTMVDGLEIHPNVPQEEHAGMIASHRRTEAILATMKEKGLDKKFIAEVMKSPTVHGRTIAAEALAKVLLDACAVKLEREESQKPGGKETPDSLLLREMLRLWRDTEKEATGQDPRGK